jgi:hypothetical protein
MRNQTFKLNYHGLQNNRFNMDLTLKNEIVVYYIISFDKLIVHLFDYYVKCYKSELFCEKTEIHD